MVKTVANIVVGAPSTAILALYGAGEGAGTSLDLGSTEGGLKVTYNPEFYFVTADQWLGKVDAHKTGEDMTVELVLAEASLQNICLALGYPIASLSGVTLQAGGNSTVTKYELYINCNGVDSGTRKITIKKCVVIGATEVSLLKKDKTGIKLTLQVLQDTSKTANQQLISIVDSSTDVTPPTVAMTSPIEDGTVVAGASTTVTLTFTEADNVMDEGTIIYDETIFINDIETPLSTALKAGTIVYNAATKTVTFTPTTVWAAAGNNYEIIVTKTVRDTAGNHLAVTFYGHFVSA